MYKFYGFEGHDRNTLASNDEDLCLKQLLEWTRAIQVYNSLWLQPNSDLTYFGVQWDFQKLISAYKQSSRSFECLKCRNNHFVTCSQHLFSLNWFGLNNELVLNVGSSVFEVGFLHS